MTRLLITGINYAPEQTGIGPYTARLAEHLSTRGYDVSVLTGMPHYPAWRVDDEYAGRLAGSAWRNGVRVERRWHYVPAKQSALRRGLYEASFLASGLTALSMPKPHAVLGIVPGLSGGLLARIVAERFHVPYGLIVQDLPGQAADQSGVRGGAHVKFVVRAAERWAAQRASAIGVVAEGFRPYIEQLGVEPARVRRVRNWTHTGQPTVGREAMREWLGLPQDAIVCLHAGNMGYKQGLENVLRCARIASTMAPRLLFVFVGDGNQRARLESTARRDGLQNVRFLPLQSEQVFPSVLACADVLLLSQRASVVDMALPSKLTSYFAAGRPVVAAAATASETAREVEWSSGGLVVAPDDPSALLDGVLRVANDDGLRRRLGDAARRWASTVLSEDAALRTYEQLVAAVLAAGDAGRVHAPPQPKRRSQPKPDLEPERREARSDERWAA